MVLTLRSLEFTDLNEQFPFPCGVRLEPEINFAKGGPAKDCNPYDGTRYLTFGNGNGIVSEQCSDSWEARTCSAAILLPSQAQGTFASFQPVADLKAAEY